MNDSKKIEARFKKIEKDLEVVKSALNIKSFMKDNFTPDGVIHIGNGYVEKDGSLNPNKTIIGMYKFGGLTDEEVWNDYQYFKNSTIEYEKEIDQLKKILADIIIWHRKLPQTTKLMNPKHFEELLKILDNIK